MKKQLLITCAFICATTSLSLADAPLVEWNIGGYDSDVPGGPPTATDFATAAIGVTALDWQLSAGAALTSSFGVFGLQNLSSSNILTVADLDITPHASFRFSANAGSQIDVTGLSYTSAVFFSPPTIGAWAYRVNNGSGFGSWTLETPFTLEERFSFSSSELFDWTFDSPIITSGTVEIGFWAVGSSANTDFANVIYSVDSGLSPGLIVNGSISAVPEPSTWGIITGATLGLLVVLRRRRRILHN